MGREGSGIIGQYKEDKQGETQPVGEVEAQVEGGIVSASLGFLHPDEDVVGWNLRMGFGGTSQPAGLNGGVGDEIA